ncbi:hypothetical protein MNV49_000119 [Pseudohyphozyma bogoriensis]|nr:hypothetical protein MNV49_000119 [Pseudohyphozyma bogoriensis]
MTTPTLAAAQLSEFGTLTLEHTLEDLSTRFIVNLPSEELENLDRVCFQIEQAHWYYEDFVRPAALNPALLPSFGLKHFSLLMFKACPLLHDLVSNHQKIWNSFMAYKERVPVCGAILISEFWDKVLLVKGWQKGASWSFPRGKINKEEAEAACAVREVLEETGFDLSAYFPPEQLDYNFVEQDSIEKSPYYVELVIKEQKIRLYFIPGIHEDTYFETRTRKEISKLDWFNISDLPTWSKEKKSKKAAAQAAAAASGNKQAKFYMVTPFISHLKLWIDKEKPKNLKKRNKSTEPRPSAPTPFSSHIHDGIGRSLPPHLQDSDIDNSNQFESDFDVERTSSPSSEEDTHEDGLRRPTQFTTTEEGTEALNAFFFGGNPGQDGARRENLGPELEFGRHAFEDPNLEAFLDQDETTSAQTPPEVAYKRQTSFFQPKPKATPDQTNKLLALLTNNNPVASPPPQKPARRGSRPAADSGPRAGGSLLNLLLGTASASDHTTPHPSSTAISDPALSPSPGPAESILFADSAPPPEAEGFGEVAVRSEAERSESERKEKHDALLRALNSVTMQSPPRFDPPLASPPPPPQIVAPQPNPNANVLLSLFNPRGSSNPPLSPPNFDRQDWAPSASPQMQAALEELRRAGSGAEAAQAQLEEPARAATPPAYESPAGVRRASPGIGTKQQDGASLEPAASSSRDSKALLAILRSGGGLSPADAPEPTPSPSHPFASSTSPAMQNLLAPQYPQHSQPQSQFPAFNPQPGPPQHFSPPFTHIQRPNIGQGFPQFPPQSQSNGAVPFSQAPSFPPNFPPYPPQLPHPQQRHPSQTSAPQGYGAQPSFSGPSPQPPTQAQQPQHSMFGPRPPPQDPFSALIKPLQEQRHPLPIPPNHSQPPMQATVPPHGSTNNGAGFLSPPLQSQPPPPPPPMKTTAQSGQLLSLFNAKPVGA